MIQTVTLETAKLLKEANFKYSGGLLWRFENEENQFILNDATCGNEEWYPAPISDELLAELPDRYKKGWLTCQKVGAFWEVGYDGSEGLEFSLENKSLPEALSQMYLWLHKQGLLDSKGGYEGNI